MKTTNIRIERIKRVYFTDVKEARRYSEQSIDAVAKALHGFESYTRFKDLESLHHQQADGFKAHFSAQVNGRTKEALSMATLYSTLAALKGFFQWLAGQAGYKSKISYSGAEYFNLGRGGTSVAKARREQSVPTLEQIRYVISMMSSATDIELCNRALIVFEPLTGALEGAVASMKLKHIDLIEGKVEQDAREVKTKFCKTLATYFFPVWNNRQIVMDWVNYLRMEKLWGLDDPLFPRTRVARGTSPHFEAAGLDRNGWTNATPICVKDAFTEAGLPYA
jgi:integrase